MAIIIFQRTVKNIIHFNSSIKWITLGIEIGKSRDFGCPFSNMYPSIPLDLGKGREEGGEGWEKRGGGRGVKSVATCEGFFEKLIPFLKQWHRIKASQQKLKYWILSYVYLPILKIN